MQVPRPTQAGAKAHGAVPQADEAARVTLIRFLGLAALLIAGSAFAQPEGEANPLATRPGWEIGTQIANYEYVEPGVMKLSGYRLGLDGSGTLASGPLFGRIEARGSYGFLDYQGTGTMTGVPDFILETRALIGADVLGSDVSFSPYLGLGYRYLFDDLRGYTSTNAAGYRRYSNYYYLPVGFTLRFRLEGGWVLAPTLEADLFQSGKQITKLSDTGIPGAPDVTNTQSTGSGYRASLMLEKDNLAFGLWTNSWSIDQSNVTSQGLYEPANHTRESGIELRYRF
jgi:hypothetical protein